MQKEIIAQLKERKEEIDNLNEEILLYEKKLDECKGKLKKLENHQASAKKMEEFNLISKEILALEKEKNYLEQSLSNNVDKKVNEEELIETNKQLLKEAQQNARIVEEEVMETVREINKEGTSLLEKKNELVKTIEPSILNLYERLLRNKKDQVVVRIKNRTCMGCHVLLTAQHENFVRKGDKWVFCEHCSRFNFLDDEPVVNEAPAISTTRGRKKAVDSGSKKL